MLMLWTCVLVMDSGGLRDKCGTSWTGRLDAIVDALDHIPIMPLFVLNPPPLVPCALTTRNKLTDRSTGTPSAISPTLLWRRSYHLPRLRNCHHPSQAPRWARVVSPGALRAGVLRRPTGRSGARRVLREQDLDPGPGRSRCVGVVCVG